MLILILIFSIYLIGFFWAHHYWSKYMNKNKIKLHAEEVSIIFSMLFLWFFYWDSIEIIMKHAERVD